MEQDIFITLAIHTYDRAVILKRMLESHGIEVRFKKFIISGTDLTAGVKMKIKETDLTLALKIVESLEVLPSMHSDEIIGSSGGKILIPVDFNPYSLKACRIGFEIAERMDLQPVILHSYSTPYFDGTFSYDDTFTGNVDPIMSQEYTDLEIGRDLKKESTHLMMDLISKIHEGQERGEIADVHFTTQITEGVADDVIKEYCRLSHPEFVVMATRGKEKKEEELVGSVTAEVLDSCRVPLFSIPETCPDVKLEDLKRIAFFCCLDQHDLLTMDLLMRMFNYPEVEIVLIPINGRSEKNLSSRIENLSNYFNRQYATANFTSRIFNSNSFLSEFHDFEAKANIDMIIVPNKRKNIFARLLNPGIAHKLLFERDLPLLSLPV